MTSSLRPRGDAVSPRAAHANVQADVRLEPAELEREFRIWEWKTALRRARGAIATASAIFLLFAYSDFLWFGTRWPLPGVLALRLSVGARGGGGPEPLAGPPRPERFDRLVLAWTLWAGLLTAVILPATRPAAWMLHGFVVCSAIPAVYLLVPMRFLGGLAVGVVMGAGYLAFVVATNAELTYMQGVVITFSLVSANVFAAVASRAHHRAQRAAFIQQRSLGRAEESLRQLVDAVPFPIVLIARADGRVRRMNDAARALFAGPDPEAAAAGLAAAAPELLAGADDGDGAVGAREVAARDGQGEARWLLVSTRPIVHDGVPSALLGLADLTARKATEDALAAAKRDADDASRAKSMFLATMSHEMRTPLHGALGAVQLLERAQLGPAEREQVAMVRASARGMLQLVDGILELTRPELGAAPDAPVVFAPRALLREVVLALAARTRPDGVVVDLDPGLPELVVGDEARIRRVLLNLVDNALRHGDATPIEVVARALAVGADGVRVRFAVSNGGPGIPAEARAAIFEPFVQLERPGALRRGFGLGLAIAREDVRAMGGELALEDGQGAPARTTFAFAPTLGAAPSDARPLPRAASSSRPLALLVAEDDPVSARLATLLLVDAGHRVTLVGTGAEAVAAAGAQAFDALLLDMRLPVLDGEAATRAIRALPDATRASVPIVAMTANALPEDRARRLAAGVSAVVAKPVEFTRLEATLAELTAPERRLPCVDEALLARYAGAIGAAEARALQAPGLATAGPLIEGIEAAGPDRLALALAAHRLASAAHSAAFARLAAAAARLEDRARADVDDPDALRSARAALTAAWQATRAAQLDASSSATPSR
ncbi:MAG: ATP-binding protein [Myxococcota bacterium]